MCALYTYFEIRFACTLKHSNSRKLGKAFLSVSSLCPFHSILVLFPPFLWSTHTHIERETDRHRLFLCVPMDSFIWLATSAPVSVSISVVSRSPRRLNQTLFVSYRNVVWPRRQQESGRSSSGSKRSIYQDRECLTRESIEKERGARIGALYREHGL